MQTRLLKVKSVINQCKMLVLSIKVGPKIDLFLWQNFASFYLLFITSLGTVLIPKLSQFIKSGKIEETKAVLTKSIQFVFLVFTRSKRWKYIIRLFFFMKFRYSWGFVIACFDYLWARQLCFYIIKVILYRAIKLSWRILVKISEFLLSLHQLLELTLEFDLLLAETTVHCFLLASDL